MGVCINEETKEYRPKKQEFINTQKASGSEDANKQIVNYGDANLLWECLKKSPLFTAFMKILPSFSGSFLAMLFYKVIDGAASCHASTWLEGNYTKILFPGADLASQRVSELLAKLGNENLKVG